MAKTLPRPSESHTSNPPSGQLATADLRLRWASTYTDLRGIGRVNARLDRLDRLDRLAGALGPHSDDHAAEVLRGLLDRTAPGAPEELLRLALRTAAGVADKTPVPTEFVSPLRLVQPVPGSSAGPDRVPDLLAGDLLVRFGGFGSRRYITATSYSAGAAAAPGSPTRCPGPASRSRPSPRRLRPWESGTSGTGAGIHVGTSAWTTCPCARLRMAAALAHAGRSVLVDVLRARRRDSPTTP